jgi:succinyl-diaminopimelate desuccinylase
MLNPVELSQALVRCPSVTPDARPVMDVIAGVLEPLGFACEHLRFSAEGTPDVDNLAASIGSGERHLAFAGHLDVVPPGEGWSSAPFDGQIRDGVLYGRGSADMKTGVAAFVAAASAYLEARGDAFDGRISLILTGDEEGPAINGTKKVMEHLKAKGDLPEVCLLGEPTCREFFGEMLKIGRRGSLTAHIAVEGVQGHVAYPDAADNPTHRLVRILDELLAKKLDAGDAHFPPSSLMITTVDVGNPATNVIPGAAKASLNIRFSTHQTSEGLERWIESVIARHAPKATVRFERGAQPFLNPPGAWSDLVAAAVTDVTGLVPQFSTTGGTSDARFIKDYCAVVEYGLPGKTMHQVDEGVAVADIESLAQVYLRVLERYFGS